MPAFILLLASTACGLAQMPLWSAVVCGLLLATIGIAERQSLAERAIKLERADVLSLAAGASLLIAQAASIGTFAVGRLLAGLLLI
jgi:hypothetical protein